MLSLLLLPDIVIWLATLAVVLVLVDKFAGRVLVHLDVLRVLASKALFDAITVWKATRQADIDIDRQKALTDFEERTLAGIDKDTATEMLKSNRNEMRLLK